MRNVCGLRAQGQNNARSSFERRKKKLFSTGQKNQFGFYTQRSSALTRNRNRNLNTTNLCTCTNERNEGKKTEIFTVK